MLKHGLRFFMAFVFTLHSAWAGGKAPTEAQWQEILAGSADISLNIYLSKYQNLKKPVDLVPTFLSSLSEKDQKAATKYFSRGSKLPTVSREGLTLTFNLDGQKTTVEIIDVIAGKFKINGLNYTHDRSMPFNELIRFLEERYAPKGYSGIWGLLIPNAEAVWAFILGGVVTLVVTVMAPAFTIDFCRVRGFSNGACSGAQDTRFANQCVSSDGQRLSYLVQKKDGSWTSIKSSLSGGKLTEFTQARLLEPNITDPEEKKKFEEKRKKATENRSEVGEFENSLVRKQLPITYILKDGELEKVEILGNTIKIADLPAKLPTGETNRERDAYIQLKGIVRAMINYCRTHGTYGEYDKELDDILTIIDGVHFETGATSREKNVIAPGKEAAKEVQTLDKKEKEDQKKVKSKKTEPPVRTSQ